MEEFKPVVFKLDKELYGLDINRVRGIEKEDCDKPCYISTFIVDKKYRHLYTNQRTCN